VKTACAAPVLRRALLMLTCLLAGMAAALAAYALTGSDWAWVAVPATVALGWLGVADPTRCDPRVWPSQAGDPRARTSRAR
jgi:hypothetical protein